MAQTVQQIKPGSPEMETLLGVGYGGMTAAEAKEIWKPGRKTQARFPTPKASGPKRS